jgi:predicted Fe-Mo cluster-binding NifX family protein
MDNKKYRVAIASTDNKNVDQHFGRAQSFLIVDVDENGDYEEVEQRFVNPVCEGGHHNEERLKRGVEAILDVDMVLVARIGPGAEAELAEHHIPAFSIPGKVPDSLKRLDGFLKLQEELAAGHFLS